MKKSILLLLSILSLSSAANALVEVKFTHAGQQMLSNPFNKGQKRCLRGVVQTLEVQGGVPGAQVTANIVSWGTDSKTRIARIHFRGDESVMGTALMSGVSGPSAKQIEICEGNYFKVIGF